MKNRYATNCNTCRAEVMPEHGTLSRMVRYGRTFWRVTCSDCMSNDREEPIGEPSPRAISKGNRTSYGVVTSSGFIGYRNRSGRCEDAPCCGCCTF